MRNYLRSPNPKYDPLKLRFSICASPLKVLPFKSYILRIWISRRQWRQSNHSRWIGKGSALFSREIHAIVIVLQTQPVRRLKRCELHPPPSQPGPAPGWSQAGGGKLGRAPCRLVPPHLKGQIQSRPSKPSFYCERKLKSNKFILNLTKQFCNFPQRGFNSKGHIQYFPLKVKNFLKNLFLPSGEAPLKMRFFRGL